MKGLAWMVAGIGVGVAAYVVFNQPGPKNRTGDSDVEDVAGRTALWGSKQRVAGTGNQLVGRAKEGIGRVTGDDQVASEGVAQQAVGGVKDSIGSVAQAAGEAIHDLNR
jgi:uncharacterized protein YjbJ (UPF0337 family)